ncbi:unnamed protein product [Polarella glacialis]|uniref:Uncharacterized protein n=1 Tax=Polarella glacialis TaxID=89957 RepID=A0A813HI99_POLGL|nr:unnamed protein product [Polarella glacialis]CAE8637424.1 unnamed protein product [Polarella glacialis]
MSLSRDGWKQCCSAILDVENFKPQDAYPSGPKHNITLLPTGFEEDGTFYAFDDPAQKDLLTALSKGEKPANYSGGKCPHSVIVAAGDGLKQFLAS